MTWIIATFYKFVVLDDCAGMRDRILAFCQSRQLKGTILLAAEGINGTVAGDRAGIEALLAYLRQDARLQDLTHKESEAAQAPFERLKVKLKREIVTMGQPQVSPAQQVGTYVEPQDWNAVISDPDVVVIDTRNDYEVSIGTFAGAQNPQTQSFRDFPSYAQQLDPQQHPKVVMFCTGGIRCEKASSYLLSQGFETVYHLKGGILKYLEAVPAEESLWQGECFVFDERVAVRQGLAPGSYEMCRGCGHPISAADMVVPEYESGIACPHCYAALTPEKRAKLAMKEQQYQQALRE
ncbi:MAG: rhodanese-related sulfurtransferase [Leptolyngbya sp. SIO4C1]|nr:rhodanese-related sulfurtransferase [Leptolyngbya sp. SIO4C1]